MSTKPIPGLTSSYEDCARCVHCGLCLSARPTYRLWQLRVGAAIHKTNQEILHVVELLDCSLRT